MFVLRSYDLSWNPDYYTPGKRSSVKVTVRSYQDSYIQASSLTMGCSSKYETETSCFPTDPSQDVELATFCGYMKLGTIGVVILEVIVGSRRRSQVAAGMFRVCDGVQEGEEEGR